MGWFDEGGRIGFMTRERKSENAFVSNRKREDGIKAVAYMLRDGVTIV